jgi:hypothetical protein
VFLIWALLEQSPVWVVSVVIELFAAALKGGVVCQWRAALFVLPVKVVAQCVSMVLCQQADD